MMCNLLSEVRTDHCIPVNAQPKASKASASSEREIKRLQEELQQAREDNSHLREKLLSSAEIQLPEGMENMEEGKLKSALIRAQRDLVGIFHCLWERM